MKIIKLVTFVLCLLVSIMINNINASEIAIQFTGLVDISGIVDGINVEVGETFIGSFTYKSDLTDTDPQTDHANYFKASSDFDFTLSFSGGASTNNLETQREVFTILDSKYNNVEGQYTDGYFFQVEYSDNSCFEITLTSSNLDLFLSDSLPINIPSLASFDLRQRLEEYNGNLPSGIITSFTQVPEPISLLHIFSIFILFFIFKYKS